jgi:hypothetical protein
MDTEEMITTVSRPPRRRIRLPYPTLPAIDAALAAPSFYYRGDKKYVHNLRVQFDHLPNVDLTKIGYSRPEGKLKQLRHHYLNDAEIERVAALLKARSASQVTSVGISFRGIPKTRQGTQGWCIESMSLVLIDGKCHATVFYRTTELILKFAADLVLLREVFERLDVAPTNIEFHFSVAWISMVFLPTLFVSTSSIGFLERLRECDRTLWISATWYLNRYLDGPPINFGPALRQGRFFQRTTSESDRAGLRDYLREHGRLATVN